MNRRNAIRRLATLFLTTASLAHAQQPKKVPRIGYLVGGNAAINSARAEAIRLALRDLGHIEGQNIASEYRYAEGKTDRIPELAAELVRLKVDIIVVAGGVIPTRAAKNATKTIPIVMMGSGLDPVTAGLVESLARPGGNITGGRRIYRGVSREAAGAAQRSRSQGCPCRGSLRSGQSDQWARAERDSSRDPARALKLTIQPWEVRTADEFDRVFAAVNKQRPDGLQVLGGGLIISNQKRIVNFALKSRVPSIYLDKAAVEAGGLMSYGADQADSYKRVAYFVDRILKGAKPADLPVEQPTKFEFVFNLRTAKQIGVTIPQSVLMRADKVIKG